MVAHHWKCGCGDSVVRGSRSRSIAGLLIGLCLFGLGKEILVNFLCFLFPSSLDMSVCCYRFSLSCSDDFLFPLQLLGLARFPWCH